MADQATKDIRIFTGTAHPEVAEEIASHLGLSLGEAEVGRFADGEIAVKIGENIRGLDVFIVQSTMPPGDNFVELLVLIDAIRRASPRRITAVIPYFAYARQDRKDESRVPISAKLVANLLTAAGVDRVITMDLHSAQIQGFFDLPLDHLYGNILFIPHIRALNIPDLVVVSPDIGGMKMARGYAKRLGADMAIIEKRREKANVAIAMNVLGEVKNRNILLVDDMVDTAGTLCEAVRVLKESGANDIYAATVHPLLSGPAIERITNSGLKKVFVANTVPPRHYDEDPEWLERLGISKLFAEAILRTHHEESISSLFLK